MKYDFLVKGKILVFHQYLYNKDSFSIFVLGEMSYTSSVSNQQGLVVWRPISANPGLNVNPGLFFFSSKAFSWTILSILFRVANHQIVDKKN